MNLLNNNTKKPPQPTKILGINAKILAGSAVSPNLKQIFPDATFTSPKRNPGIYIFYFKDKDKVYLGESLKVKREICHLFRPYALSTRPYLKTYVESSGLDNIDIFTILSGPAYADTSYRKKEERRLILQAGSKAINIAFNPLKKPINSLSHPLVINPILNYRKGPWNRNNLTSGKHTLPYENLAPRQGEFCLYVIMNTATGNFYIGQTAVPNVTIRINKHKSAIRKNQYYLYAHHKKLWYYPSYERVIEDMKKDSPIFEYSIIKYLDSLTKKERLKIEADYIAEALLK